MEWSKLNIKTGEKILDEFGKFVAEDCFDPSYANLLSLRNKEKPPKIFEEYVSFIKGLNEKDFDILSRYLKENIESTLHDFLRIFEENQRFKIVYDDNGLVTDLNEISEMLKAEPLVENGWIERFSKEFKK